MNDSALQLFRNACGLSSPLSLEFEAEGRTGTQRVVRQFRDPFVLIGRDPRCNFVLDHAQVSKRHAFLQVIAGRVFVVDLQSRTGLCWESEKNPQTRGWLVANRYVQIGPVRMRQIDSLERHQELPEQALVPKNLPDAQIENDHGVSQASIELPFRTGKGPSLWPIANHVVVVGRSDTCDFVVNDDSVSKFHAALVPTPLGVWVVDLLAREGVHVNGQQVRWAWLADGDAFRLGTFTFVLRYEVPPDAMTRDRVPLEAGSIVVEKPGTEVALRVVKPDLEPQSLVVAAPRRSTIPLKMTGDPQSLETERFDPNGWNSSVGFSVNPMAMWQQQMQMMESFHNEMILMVQMFLAMHREHQASVRAELEMVQRLTNELNALQTQVNHAPEAGRANLKRVSDVNHADSKNYRDETTTKQVASIERSRSSNKHQKGLDDAKSSDVGDAIPMSSQHLADCEPSGTGTAGSEHIHAGLTQRIAKLQHERRGYWQRILDTMNK